MDTIARLNVGFSLLTLFPGRVGGSETYVRGLLREYAKDGGRAGVTVLANRHVMSAYGPEFRSALPLHEVTSYRPGDSMPTRALAMAAARLAPGRVAAGLPAGLDLLHYPVTVPIPRFDGPTVVTSHELLHHVLPDTLSRAERAYRRWAYDAAIQQADHVVAVTRDLRERIVERLEIPAERISVIYLGIHADRFAPEPDETDAALAERLSLPNRFILYPANIWPHKNHGRLLEGLARVADPELRLVLAGQDYGRLARLMARAADLGIADRICHVGQVPADLTPGLYRRATALVFPSLYENCSSPPLEAMASGCPVACSTGGALREVCGEGALMFDPLRADAIAHAIERITTDDELRGRLRKAGRDHVTRFSWPEAALRHRAVYERVAVSRA
jgi:glycosyltransferase involved in cell wall biosynthesis